MRTSVLSSMKLDTFAAVVDFLSLPASCLLRFSPPFMCEEEVEVSTRGRRAPEPIGDIYNIYFITR